MEYERVKQLLRSITDTIKRTPSAYESLRQEYSSKGWLDPSAKPPVEDLVNLALGRIEQNVKTYEEFVTILNSIHGMDQIVEKLPGKNILFL